MYEAHFCLNENPFGVNPDPRFLFLSEVHQEALAHLVYGVRQRKGFIVITGDVGTGKTTLLNKLLQGLDARTRWVFLSNPRLSAEDFLRTIARSLGLPLEGEFSKADFLFRLEGLLADALRRSENVVLVVDEAQNLSPELLEEIRLLSNLETAAEKMLQIILVGQQELNDKLLRDDLRQLRQRVSIKYHLQPLGAEDARRYVLHRLAVAGGEGSLFNPEALQEIYAASRGFPRLINNICDNSLLTAYSQDLDRVDETVVRQTLRDIEASYPRQERPPQNAPPPTVKPAPPAPSPRAVATGKGWYFLGAATVLLLALLALLALSYNLWGGLGPLLSVVH
jgi:general secretion pathway protein A